uniref:Uncharacterized protein n=1 Tax=Oryza rufipogon TaxID=4529 RepID=A0A0E0R5G2_ORYRU
MEDASMGSAEPVEDASIGSATTIAPTELSAIFIKKRGQRRAATQHPHQLAGAFFGEEGGQQQHHQRAVQRRRAHENFI